jgi:dCTP deaminase
LNREGAAIWRALPDGGSCPFPQVFKGKIMSQLSDIEITDLCVNNTVGWKGMIDPFLTGQVRKIEDPRDRNVNWAIPIVDEGIRAISAGVCSYGYDFRLSPNSFKVFHNAHAIRLVDPKSFDENLLIEQRPTRDETGTWFVIPGNSYALCETVEYVRMPRILTAISVGKSTYARCGLITNVTPFEAGWEGIVTLELANASPAPLKVYANEGICQTVFFRGNRLPAIAYSDRQGKYQGQKGLTLAKV